MNGVSLVPCMVAAGGLAFSGMALLSMAMERHWGPIAARPGVPWGQCVALRGLWALLFAVALWGCVAGAGLGVGLVTWTSWLTVGTLAVAVLLSYAPRHVPWLAAVFATLAAGATGFALMARSCA